MNDRVGNDWIGYVKAVIVDLHKRGRLHCSKADLDEYIGEGMVALARALNTFDPDCQKANFKTYLVRCVVNSVKVYRERQLRMKRDVRKNRELDTSDGYISSKHLSYRDKDIYEDPLAPYYHLLSPNELNVIAAAKTGPSLSKVARDKGISRQRLDSILKRIGEKIREAQRHEDT